MKRILVTGSRDHTDRDLIYRALNAQVWEWFGEPTEEEPMPGLMEVVLIHGDAPGADTIAADWAVSNFFEIERYPADWEQYGKAAGPIRNNQMVATGADVCIAFPLPGSRGTIHCMKAAERAGIPVRVIEPREDAS